ncbi:MAG: hypothetical protein WCP80_04055 [Phycisphaerales bacterium]
MKPLQTAILRHTTTDGRHHFDWLLAGSVIVQPDARETLCWRCPSLLTAMDVHDHMIIEAISKHRGFYLTLQSARELDGGRGRVEPIARGWAHELHENDHAHENRSGQHRTATSADDTMKCRTFILHFEGTPPLCVTLQGDLLTRVDDLENVDLGE